MPSKWTALLLEHENLKTRATKSTYKTYKTPNETPRPDSFVGFVGEIQGPRSEKHAVEWPRERAAIQEFDGGLSRADANMAASQDYDRQRGSYELANPEGDAAMVAALYRHHIQDWAPQYPGDLPAVPPCTKGNSDLWRLWWKRVEG